MNAFPTGMLVTMHGTSQLGRIVRARNVTQFAYDVPLEDGTLIEATSAVLACRPLHHHANSGYSSLHQC